MSTKAPILLIGFNRPEKTKEVLKAIRAYKPDALYLAVDGARNSEEAKKVLKVQAVMQAEADWGCTIFTQFGNMNLGCKKGVVSAISWFFSQVEQGVILEDDCVPSLDYLKFCEEMLEYYKTDTRIFSICGSNHGLKTKENSYYFSSLAQVWGWASWRRAWSGFDVELNDWSAFKSRFDLKDFTCSPMEGKRQGRNYDAVAQQKIDTWDYSWNFHVLKNHGMNVISNSNGVLNIGHDNEGTHTFADQDHVYKQYDAFPAVIDHPQFMLPNRALERAYGKLKYGFSKSGKSAPLKKVKAGWRKLFG